MWFREVNEKLERRALKNHVDPEEFEAVCECDREECAVRIPLSIAEYESVRSDATAFVVAPGHEDTRVERTLWATERFAVVAKMGEAGSVAEAEDPRG